MSSLAIDAERNKVDKKVDEEEKVEMDEVEEDG